MPRVRRAVETTTSGGLSWRRKTTLVAIFERKISLFCVYSGWGGVGWGGVSGSVGKEDGGWRSGRRSVQSHITRGLGTGGRKWVGGHGTKNTDSETYPASCTWPTA